MEIHSVDRKDIKIADRQRTAYDADALAELMDSISSNGLINPVTIRKNSLNATELVAGWRRMRAMELMWALGREVRCGTQTFPEGFVPCLWLGELDSPAAYEIELEENIRREDLSWQDRARATRKLYELRLARAEAGGTDPPTTASLTKELYGDGPLSGGAFSVVRTNLLVSVHLHDPEVAAAPNADDALKILKRREEHQRARAIGERLGPTLKSLHEVKLGDCFAILKEYRGEFDVVLTDPPYGVDAAGFGDSGGKAGGAHEYADDPAIWREVVMCLPTLIYAATKQQAHAYIFCDLDSFHELRARMGLAGWKVFRTPIIWVNPTANRAPWPEQGPMRKWQMILYAVKGDKLVTKVYPDVITQPSDPNIGHRAQKPIGLYRELLQRSVTSGNKVIDPFCGTGPIFPAAHELKCIATGIEIDPVAYGIAVQRIQRLIS